MKMWNSNSPTIWKPRASSPGAKFDGYHTVLFVGYDDNKQAFKMRNSWGVNWPRPGDGGHTDFPYADILHILEAYVFTYRDVLTTPTPPVDPPKPPADPPKPPVDPPKPPVDPPVVPPTPPTPPIAPVVPPTPLVVHPIYRNPNHATMNGGAWMYVIIVSVFFVCLLIAAIGMFFSRR